MTTDQERITDLISRAQDTIEAEVDMAFSSLRIDLTRDAPLTGSDDYHAAFRELVVAVDEAIQTDGQMPVARLYRALRDSERVLGLYAKPRPNTAVFPLGAAPKLITPEEARAYTGVDMNSYAERVKEALKDIPEGEG